MNAKRSLHYFTVTPKAFQAIEKIMFRRNLCVSMIALIVAIGMFGGAIMGEILRKDSFVVRWSFTNTLMQDLEFIVLLDQILIFFASSVLLIAAAVILFSTYYIRTEKFYSRFHILVFGFVVSMLLIVSRPRIFSILLGWDGLGVTSFLLVIYYQNSKSINAGFLTIFTNRLGDVLIILTLCIMYLRRPCRYRDLNLSRWLFRLTGFMIIVAAFTKSAQLPFSAWLPAAMAAPTPVSSLVHSSTLVTAGVYLLIRFFPILKDTIWQDRIFLMGVRTIMIAGLTAVYDNDIKKVVAFSTLSQLGLMVTTVGLGAPELAFYHLLVHAYFKAMLFLVVGILIHLRTDYQDFNKLPYWRFNRNFMFASIAARNFRLIGIPFISGFFTKDAILELSLTSAISRGALMGVFFGVLCTVGYRVRLLARLAIRKEIGGRIRMFEANSRIALSGVMVLWPWVLVRGARLGWVLTQIPEVRYVRFTLKIGVLIFVLILVRIWSKLRLVSFYVKPSYWRMATIWNLSFLRTPFLALNWLRLRIRVFYRLDLSWFRWRAFRLMGRVSNNRFVRRFQLDRESWHAQFFMIRVLMILPFVIYLCIYVFKVS